MCRALGLKLLAVLAMLLIAAPLPRRHRRRDLVPVTRSRRLRPRPTVRSIPRLRRYCGARPRRWVKARVAAFTRLTGVDPRADPAFVDSSWQSVTNHLIAWDLPAPPGYRSVNAALFLLVEPRWEPFFADVDADIDWRLVSWAGC